MKCIFCQGELKSSKTLGMAWCPTCTNDEDELDHDRSNYLVYITRQGTPYEAAITFSDGLFLNMAWHLPNLRETPIVYVKQERNGECLLMLFQDMRWVINSTAEEIRDKINLWLTFL